MSGKSTLFVDGDVDFSAGGDTNVYVSIENAHVVVNIFVPRECGYDLSAKLRAAADKLDAKIRMLNEGGK